MTDAVEAAGLPNMIWFNYRRVPAVALARQVIEEGRLGRIFHYRAKYLQDWTISPDVPQGGRLCGAWMSTWPGAKSQGTYWLTRSTRHCGSMARLSLLLP